MGQSDNPAQAIWRKTSAFQPSALPLILLLVLMISLPLPAFANTLTWTLDTPSVTLSGVPFEVKAEASEVLPGAEPQLVIAGEGFRPDFSVDGRNFTFSSVVISSGATARLVVNSEQVTEARLSSLPAWMSLLPVILAIAMALTLRQVIPAIFLGLWAGASLVHGISIFAPWKGLLDTVSVYVLQALADEDHMSIILFSLMIGGLVGIVNRNGGMDGIVEVLKHLASTRRRGQAATGLLGTAIFFDDYANTMVVGNAMRPITDKLKISREKLAYLVDSTAAPIASIGLITTWIGFQVGLIDDSIKDLSGVNESAYSIFLNSIPYGFYSIFAIAFVYMVAASGRDFGPMLAAEKRARSADHKFDSILSAAAPDPIETLDPGKEIKPQAMNAILPLIVLIFGTLLGIYITGRHGLGPEASLRDIIGNGNSYQAMIWASFLAVLLAVVLSRFHQRIKLSAIIDAWMDGVKTMILAIIVLTPAWSLAGVNETLQTAEFLASTLSDAINPVFLPVIVFILAAAMAFATGSSWGVMGIMIPLTIPLTWSILSGASGGEVNLAIFYASVASLLSGAVWGDHSSPISDTTILSSMASDCDHLAHVQTQLPYAFVVAVVAIVIGLVPAGFGISPLVSLPLGLVALAATIRFLGRPSDEGQSKN